MVSRASRRAAVLDRDGTLIDFHRDEEHGAIVSAFHPAQLRILPGVVEGLGALSKLGFALAIATNQPGAAKGQVSRAAIERTNAALVELLAASGVVIEAVEVCFHHPSGAPSGDPSLVGLCDCRKPAPGLLLRLAARLGLDAARSFMIGDADVDVAAAHAAGFGAALLFDPRRCELCPLRASSPAHLPDLVAPTLPEIAALIAAKTAAAYE